MGHEIGQGRIMYTYHFNYLNATQPHEVLDPKGYVILRTRIKHVAKERVDMENRAVSMRKEYENSRKQVA